MRYSEKEWNKIAANEFAYCDRLRASEYLSLFEEAGFDICRCETEEDDEARQSLVDGFAVNFLFDNYMLDDLSTIQLRIALKAEEKEDMAI